MSSKIEFNCLLATIAKVREVPKKEGGNKGALKSANLLVKRNFQ